MRSRLWTIFCGRNLSAPKRNSQGHGRVEITPVPPPALRRARHARFNVNSPLLIHHLPQSRRQRMARLRTAALVAIATIAASGILLQGHARHGAQVASVQEPFTYFPG